MQILGLPSFGPNPAGIRDPTADYLKAVNVSIAEREAAGLEPTPYLLEQKETLEAKIAARDAVKGTDDPES